MKKLYFLLLLLFWGCSAWAPHVLREKLILIEQGQSKQDVLQLLGTPGNRQFQENSEAWQYCETSYTGSAGDDYLVVWFTRGKVTGITTYTNHNYGSCESFFRTIRWEDAPDYTIEHRIR